MLLNSFFSLTEIQEVKLSDVDHIGMNLGKQLSKLNIPQQVFF